MRRLIPSRRAISRCESPSAASVLTCAHSNRSAPPASSLDSLTERLSLSKAADAISGAASGALFACRSWRSIRLPASAAPRNPPQPDDLDPRLHLVLPSSGAPSTTGMMRPRLSVALNEANDLSKDVCEAAPRLAATQPKAPRPASARSTPRTQPQALHPSVQHSGAFQ